MITNMKEICAVYDSHKASLGMERPRAREKIVSQQRKGLNAHVLRMYYIIYQLLIGLGLFQES